MTAYCLGFPYAKMYNPLSKQPAQGAQKKLVQKKSLIQKVPLFAFHPMVNWWFGARWFGIRIGLSNKLL